MADLESQWRLHEVDIPRWVSPRPAPDPMDDPLPPLVAASTFPSGPGELGAARGVLWTHTPGPVGAPDFLDSERVLASHYWSGGVIAPIEIREPFPCMEAIVPFVVLSPDICPFCAGSLPIPWAAFPTGFACPQVRFDQPVLAVEGGVLEPQPGLELTGLDVFADDPGP